MPRNFVNATLKVSHFYADGTSGSDLNDGLTALTPKKTLQAVFALVPRFIQHNTSVHLVGVFSEQGTTDVTREVEDTVYFIIDGGIDTTIVADDGGSPWEADIHSTTSIGLTGVGWTVDQYVGYWVEIVNGVLAGTKVMIQGNTADTLTPHKNFASDPGTAQFRIVRPSTEFAASSISSKLSLTVGGNGYVHIQNVYLSGSKFYIVTEKCTTSVVLASVISDSTSYYSFFIGRGSGGILSSSSGRDPNSFAYVAYPGGVSARQENSRFSVFNQTQTGFFNSYISWLIMDNGSIGATRFVQSGARIRTMVVTGSFPSALSDDTQWEIGNTSAYATTKFGGGTVGIKLINSCMRIESGDISNCSSHGIECIQSRLELKGAVTGSNNGGAGVYAHDNSIATIKDGSPPTLTGTVGDCSTDGTTERTTWAEVDADSAITDLYESTTIKEVA